MPKEIYVRVDTIFPGDLSAYTELADAIEDDGPTTIGVYKLMDTIKRKKIIADAK